MIAFVFPGQGSQKKGMGQGLFDEVREYAAVEKDVDAIVGYSMRTLCLEAPENNLKQTQFTQPALYVVNALHYYKALSEGTRPEYLAGHSLGEYNALLAADVRFPDRTAAGPETRRVDVAGKKRRHGRGDRSRR